MAIASFRRFSKSSLNRGRWPQAFALGLFLLFCAFESADSQSIPSPLIPNRSFDITHFGAIPDATTLNTQAIQKTLDACRAAGGGTVLIPPGRFLTAPITLCSNLDLHLEKGATLLMTPKPSDYPHTNRGYQDCILATDCHDISVTGPGTIDGQGAGWWAAFRKQTGSPLPAGTPDKSPAAEAPPAPLHRPFLLVFKNCQRVLVRDVLLTNSPMFNLVPQQCRDVVIDNIKIQDPTRSPNTDGIDPSGWNFLITNCTIDVGDDCIAIKPTFHGDDLKPTPNSLSCENFTITHCTFLHGHGMSIGNPTPGGLRHLTVSDCSFDSTDAGIRMKTHRDAGGPNSSSLVEDLTYQNLTMKNVKVAILITSYYPRIPKDPQNDPAQPVTDSTPIWRNIRISNVTATGGAQAARIIGLPEMPISDLVLDHVNISATRGMQIVHAKGIKFIDCSITATSGPAVDAHDADITGLDQPAIPTPQTIQR